MSKYKILREYENSLMHIEDIIGPNETTNIQLDILGKRIFGERFLGVFSSDTFPKYVKQSEMFIINVDPHYKGGSHWCAVYKHGSYFYLYDSFNRKAGSLSKFWKSKKIISANTDRDQSYNEDSCGARSLSWLCLADTYSPPKIMSII